MKATTLLLATLLTATAQQEQPETPAPGTKQSQRGQSAAAEPPPSPTTIINQGIGKEEIQRIVQRTLEEQARHQQLEQPETPLLSWIKIFLAAATLIVAVFTALIAFLGVLAWRNMKEMDKTKQELGKILKDARKKHEKLRAMTAEKVRENPDKAKEMAARSEDYESPIDKAIAEAIAYQTNEQHELAKEKWLAIANITEEQDSETAARAYFSATYLIQEYNDKYKSKDEATLSEVISLYNKTLNIKPEFAEALNNRGSAKRELGQFQEALEDFNNALKIKPDYVYALNNRGLAKAELGQHQEAIKDYDKALELKPNFSKALYNRGNAKNNLGQFQKAIEDYSKALELKPDYADALCNRGNAKAGLGQFQEAIEDFDKALTIKPDDAEALISRGNAKMGLGQFREAIEDHDKALEIKPDDTAALYGRTLAKLALGDLQGAKEDTEQALQIDPNNENAKKLLAMIKDKYGK